MESTFACSSHTTPKTPLNPVDWQRVYHQIDHAVVNTKWTSSIVCIVELFPHEVLSLWFRNKKHNSGPNKVHCGAPSSRNMPGRWFRQGKNYRLVTWFQVEPERERAYIFNLELAVFCWAQKSFVIDWQQQTKVALANLIVLALGTFHHPSLMLSGLCLERDKLSRTILESECAKNAARG